MFSNLLEGDFNPPTKYEPLDHLDGVNRGLGAQQRLRLQLTEWVLDEYPSDRYRGPAPAIPVCGLRYQLKCAGGSIVLDHRHAIPVHIVVAGEVDERGQSLSLDARTSDLSGQSDWWRFVECRVESQPGDEGDRLCQGLAEVEQFECGVVTVCDHDDVSGG